MRSLKHILALYYKVTTNTQFIKILPKEAEVTRDFLFFEQEFSGFRPFEIAVSIQGDYDANDFEVIQEMDKIEQHFKQYPAIKSMSSITGLYKSINQAYNSNNPKAFKLPNNTQEFKKHQKLAKRMSKNSPRFLITRAFISYFGY